MKNISVGVLVFLFSFTGTALAADLATDPSVTDLIKPIFEAVKSGNSFLAAAMTLVLLVALARRYGISRFPFLGSDAGGAAMTLVGSFGGALSTALLAGSAPSLGLLSTALGIAVAASGGYSMAKRLLVPLLEKLATKCPAWMHPMFDLVLWVFGRSSAIAKAEKAGADALKADPAKGLSAVAGDPKDVD
jgi:hypothetical protein